MNLAKAALPLLLGAVAVHGYCNGMSRMGYGPRTSTAFPPGWNNMTRTPHRGWRSWYAYYTHMNEDMIKEAVDALAAKNRTVKGWDGKVSLCDLGYCTAGIDEGWEGCGQGVNGTQHYVNGTPAANPVTFPDMQGLVDYSHSKGVKMGWYFNGCGCIEKREPASGWAINYEGDIERLAQFGFDGVKFDGCGRMCNMTFYAALMEKTGKAFEIENCHWGACTVDDASSCPTKDWCPFNWYRTSGDSNNAMGTWYKNLQTTIRFQDWNEPLSQPGCWAYPDMLQVGRLGCSSQTHGCPMPSLINWTKTHFAAFCIVSSPLVLSIHPSDENLEPILDIIGNKMAMSINQAWAGHPGTLVRELPPTAASSYTSLGGNTVTTFTLAKAEQAGLDGCQIYDNTSPVYLRSGSTSQYTSATMDLKLLSGTITAVSFGYRYVTGYDMGTVGANFTLEVAGTPVYTSPLLKNYPCNPCANSHGNDSQYSPSVTAAANGLSIVVPSSGGDVVFKFHNIDRNLQIELPLQINITCAGQSPCFTSAPPSPPAVAGVQLWSKPLGGGKVAALLINGGSLAYPSTNISLKDFNITSGIEGSRFDAAAVTVTDVWTGEDAGPVIDGQWLTGMVQPLDSRFVILDASAAVAVVSTAG